MLTSLRKNKENLIIKIVLLVIILSFALYFGTSNLGSSNSTTGSAAEVNDKSISAKRADFLLRSRLEQINKGSANELPESIVLSIKNTIINQLVNQELIAQELLKLGLETPNEELVEHITTHPQFTRNGKFDKHYYTKRFLPHYNYQRGSSFENDTKQILTTQKLFDEFETALIASKEELNKTHNIQNTKYKFEVIRIPIENKKDEASTDAPEKIAKDLFTQWKNGVSLKSSLDKHKLTKKNTSELTITNLAVGLLSHFWWKSKNRESETALFSFTKKTFSQFRS